MNQFLNILLHFGIGFLFSRVWSSVGQGSRLGFLLHCWFGVLIGLGANALLNLFRIMMGSATTAVSLQTSSIIICGSVFEAFVFGLLFAPKHLETPLSNPSSKPISRMPSTSTSNPLSSSTNALTNSASNIPQPSVSLTKPTTTTTTTTTSESLSSSKDLVETPSIKKKKVLPANGVAKLVKKSKTPESDTESTTSATTTLKKKKKIISVESDADSTTSSVKKRKSITKIVKKPSKPINPNYPPATDADFEKFITLARDTSKWTNVYKDHKVAVYEQPSATADSHISIVKLETTFPELDAIVLYDALHDPEYRKVWDDRMVEGFEIERLDHFNDVGYYQAKAPPGFENRDWVNQRSWRVRDDTEYIIMNHSVVHPACPERPHVVRANSIITGYLVEALPDGGCSLTYCTQNDSRGWIPTWIKNFVTRKFAPSIVEKMHKAAAEYEAWRAQERPGAKRPWRQFDD